MTTDATHDTEPASRDDPHDTKAAVVAPLVAFGVVLVALVPFFMWAGRGEWFEHDDWDYLVLRKAGNLGDGILVVHDP
ncbi:MAG TPA: hypothetical protein VK771_03315, partial [Acidimicrobiia bacterium]|nr:hypothetical protein [Acidimicrobiia bacterium]